MASGTSSQLDPESRVHEEISRYAKAAGGGDRGAFSALFGLRVSAVYAALACLWGGDELLDALAIHVFERAWRRMLLLNRPERFVPWLLEVVIEGASEAPSGGGAVSTGLPGIAAALASLVPLHREVVLLRNMFRLSARNVGCVLDIEPDEVHRPELTALELMSERVAA